MSRRAWRYLLSFSIAALAAAQPPTALDRYVAAPDGSYKWEVVKTYPSPNATAYVVDMTSQTWLTPAEVDRQVWQHSLTIVRPKELKTDVAFLFITGRR